MSCHFLILTVANSVNQVLSTLDFMSARFDTLTSHTRTMDEFQTALMHVHTAALQHLSPDPTTEAKPPLKRHPTHKSQSSFAAIKLKPTKSLDIPPALQDALRHAGISFNQDSIEALRDSLVKTQLEREKKLAEHYVSASSSTHDELAQRFGRADAEARVITDALYAHTPFGTTRLVDPEVEQGIEKAEEDVRDVESELLNAEANLLSLDDARVREFVRKYGR